MQEQLKKEHRAKMERAVNDLHHAYETLRTGRASVSLVDHIKVAAYGSEMPLVQLASLTTPDARTIAIQPFDPSQISAIEKALLASNIGITPSNDGKIIRLHIPQLTEDRRKDLVKLARKYAEEHRVGVRQARHHLIDAVKGLEKKSEISEDESRRLQDDADKITKEYIEKIDKELAHKEAEIMEV